MIARTNTKQFEKQMSNIVDYAIGFLDGIEKGKSLFLKNLGQGVIETLAAYIDVSARGNPNALHHVYEWYKTGSPSARLFDLEYTVSKSGLRINSSFRQSRTLQEDANVPFYNKARIMEEGVSVTISPKKSSVLVFNEGGKTIFTKGSVTVRNPGGEYVQGSFENIMDEFMLKYFKQSFIKSSGLYDYISRPTVFKKNIKAGSKAGKNKGIDTGYKWIINENIGVE
jgi:hypothetical protein